MFGPHTSIIFVPTARCNCDCAYCFQERSQANLSMEEVSTLFGRAAGYLSRSGVRRVDVYWQGGEIMVLSPDWCLEAGRAISALMGRQGVGCKHFLQTNLMEYTPEWDQVIWELFDGSVGSSLDFPNIHRRFRGLSGDDYSEHWT
ncbi:MAG: hypothetical protein FJY85_17590, partial [Deltaproteobacteria bacterium]|nr:hypothetical protein [Deltaproteobacteria bacterium]